MMKRRDLIGATGSIVAGMGEPPCCTRPEWPRLADESLQIQAVGPAAVCATITSPTQPHQTTLAHVAPMLWLPQDQRAKASGTNRSGTWKSGVSVPVGA